VRLIKDDEHLDRFFISAARNGMVFVTVVDPIAADLARAAEELAAEAARSPDGAHLRASASRR
jgi:hypothetical protein